MNNKVSKIFKYAATMAAGGVLSVIFINRTAPPGYNLGGRNGYIAEGVAGQCNSLSNGEPGSDLAYEGGQRSFSNSELNKMLDQASTCLGSIESNRRDLDTVENSVLFRVFQLGNLKQFQDLKGNESLQKKIDGLSRQLKTMQRTSDWLENHGAVCGRFYPNVLWQVQSTQACIDRTTPWPKL